MYKILLGAWLTCSSVILQAHHGFEGITGTNTGSRFSALLIKKGQFLFESNFRSIAFNSLEEHLFGSEQSNLINNQSILGLDYRLTYGLMKKLNISISSSYIQLNYQNWTGDYASKNNLRLSGFLDPYFELSFPLYQDSFTSIVGGVGCELPFGSRSNYYNNTYNGMNSNTWDPGAKIMITRKMKKGQFILLNQYKYTFENDDEIQLGANNNASVLYSFPLVKETCCGENSCAEKSRNYSISMFSGAQYSHMGVSKKQGSNISNTSFTRVLFSVGGIISIKKKMVVPISIDLPVYQQLKGNQSKQLFNCQVGFSYLFG